MIAEALPSQADWGRTAETAACERFGLELVSDDPDAPWWFDAESTAPIQRDGFATVAGGTPIDVKAARYRIENGTPRRGRWWISEANHEQLRDASGEYALAVYSVDGGVHACCLRPAWFVTELVTKWSPCGSGHRADRAAQIPWSRVFDDAEVMG